MENILNRKLTSEEVIHHINGDKTDNRQENLELTNQSKHSKYHSKKAEFIEISCCVCDNKYMLRKKEYERRSRKGQKMFMCSKRCVGLSSAKYFPHDKHDNIGSLFIEEKVKEGLNKGMSGYRIAEVYGLNRKSVYNHIHKLQKSISSMEECRTLKVGT